MAAKVGAKSKVPCALAAELASKLVLPAAIGPQSERLTDAAAAAVAVAAASKAAPTAAIGGPQSERLTDAAAVAEDAVALVATGLRVLSGAMLAKERLSLS